MKRELKAKATDASKSDADGARLEEKATRAQADLERNNARFEGLLQDKVAEIGRLGATLKDLRQQHVDKQQQSVHRAEGGYGEVVDILRSLGDSQVHCGVRTQTILQLRVVPRPSLRDCL